jgi:hypothetical protein
MTSTALRPILAADRTNEINQLYFHNLSDLQTAVLTGTDLLPNDGEYIIELLATFLPQYDGPLEDEPFVAWALGVIRPEADKRKWFYQLKRDHSGIVLEGVWKVLCNAKDLCEYDAPSKTALCIAADAWVWVSNHLDELAIEGTAEISTRLCHVGYWAARTWKTYRLRDRKRFVYMDFARVGQVEGSEFDENGDAIPAKLVIEPDYDEDGEDELAPLQRPVRILESEGSAQSGAPRLLCLNGCGLQVATDMNANTVRLKCGHKRKRAA